MFGEETAVQRAVVVAVSFFASIASYYLVECPIRFDRPGPFATTYGTLITGLAMLIAGTAGSLLMMHSAQRELAKSQYLTAIFKARTEGVGLPGNCNHPQFPFAGLAPVQQCTLGDRTASRAVVLWGDSHADALLPLFDLLGKRNGYAVIARTRGGCRPFYGPLGTVGIRRGEMEIQDCARFNSAVISQLVELNKAGARTVIIASRWPPEGEKEKVAAADWAGQLLESVHAAHAAGLKVVLAADVPQFQYSVPNCLARRPEAACEAVRSDVDVVRNQAVAVLKSIAAESSDIKVWDPINELCDQSRCWVSVGDNVILFLDDNHLSVPGALWLAGRNEAQLAAMLP
jgi:SGNH domain (fused to AT3 domains)